MQRKLQAVMNFHPDPEGSTDFDVVIVYEDFQSGKHGIRTYDYLVKNLGKECQVSNQMWKFDILAISSLRDLALKDAREADIIIVSCRGTAPLPETVVGMLEDWSRQPGDALALVALFEDPEAVEASQTRDYLTGLAKRSGLEFFAQPDAWPAMNEIPDRLAFSDLHPAIMDPRSCELHSPRWGINE